MKSSVSNLPKAILHKLTLLAAPFFEGAMMGSMNLRNLPTLNEP